MSKQYINIAIAGLSLSHSEELKNQLRNMIPQDYIIKWITATDPNIDCLFIHETFYETEGIQRIINKKCFPWLKITKHHQQQQLTNNVLNFPVSNHDELTQWLNHHVLNQEQTPEAETVNHIEAHEIDEEYLSEVLNPENHAKLHLFDAYGSIGIAKPDLNTIWIIPERKKTGTDSSFSYDLANTDDFMKIYRKEKYILQDWLWNFYWNSPELLKMIAPDDGHFKILSWPKPSDIQNKKLIFQLSAVFIQGAKISKIADHFNISQQLIIRFIATNLAMNNAVKINIWDKHFTPPTPEIQDKKDDQSLIKNFFGKIRKKFGF